MHMLLRMHMRAIDEAKTEQARRRLIASLVLVLLALLGVHEWLWLVRMVRHWQTPAHCLRLGSAMLKLKRPDGHLPVIVGERIQLGAECRLSAVWRGRFSVVGVDEDDISVCDAFGRDLWVIGVDSQGLQGAGGRAVPATGVIVASTGPDVILGDVGDWSPQKWLTMGPVQFSGSCGDCDTVVFCDDRGCRRERYVIAPSGFRALEFAVARRLQHHIDRSGTPLRQWDHLLSYPVDTPR